MGKITIQDVLGSDNVGASRAVILSNIKLLADGINKLETFLNTTPAGGDLTIANILIKKHEGITEDEELFHNQASSRIDGNLTVLQQLIVGTGQDETSEINSNLSITGKFITERPVENNQERTSNINGSISFGDIVSFGGINLDGYLKYPVENESILEVLAFDTTSEEISGRNNITIQWDSEHNELELGDGYHGQILIVKNSGIKPNSESIELKHKEEEEVTASRIIKYDEITSNELLEKITTVLIFEATNPDESQESKIIGKWKVISSTKPNNVEEEITG